MRVAMYRASSQRSPMLTLELTNVEYDELLARTQHAGSWTLTESQPNRSFWVKPANEGQPPAYVISREYPRKPGMGAQIKGLRFLEFPEGAYGFIRNIKPLFAIMAPLAAIISEKGIELTLPLPNERRPPITKTFGRRGPNKEQRVKEDEAFKASMGHGAEKPLGQKDISVRSLKDLPVLFNPNKPEIEQLKIAVRRVNSLCSQLGAVPVIDDKTGELCIEMEIKKVVRL